MVPIKTEDWTPTCFFHLPCFTMGSCLILQWAFSLVLYMTKMGISNSHLNIPFLYNLILIFGLSIRGIMYQFCTLLFRLTSAFYVFCQVVRVYTLQLHSMAVFPFSHGQLATSGPFPTGVGQSCSLSTSQNFLVRMVDQTDQVFFKL